MAFQANSSAQNCQFENLAVQKNSLLEGLRLIGSVVVELNHPRTITKASATGLGGRQGDYNKGICSPGSLFNYLVRYDTSDTSFSLKGRVVFDFSNVTKWQIFFLIFFNQQRNKSNLH